MTPRSPIRDFASALVVAVLCATFVRTFLVQVFKIPSASMAPTLWVGDHVLVNRFVFGGLGDERPPPSWLPMRVPRRGDVVVFRWPRDDGRDVVKRCLGEPGETLEITGGRLEVDGRRLAEPYLDPSRDRHLGDFGPATVPPGHLFLLGDHRADSSDSREHGSVPVAQVRGRAWIIFWSFEMPRERQDWSIIEKVLGGLWRSRWNRCLKLVR